MSTFVRQSDRDLISAARKGVVALGKVQAQGGYAADLKRIAVALLTDAADDLSRAVAAVDAEAVEASEAHVQLAKAEDLAEASFGDLYDALVLTEKHTRLGNRANPPAYLDDLARYLEGNNPSDFTRLGRDNKLVVMEKALGYVDRFTSANLVPRAVIDDAFANHQAYEAAYRRWQAEDADVTEARNACDAARAEARNYYISARLAAEAALRLGAINRPIGEYLVSLASILRSKTSASQPATGADAPQPA